MSSEEKNDKTLVNLLKLQYNQATKTHIESKKAEVSLKEQLARKESLLKILSNNNANKKSKLSTDSITTAFCDIDSSTTVQESNDDMSLEENQDLNLGRHNKIIAIEESMEAQNKINKC